MNFVDKIISKDYNQKELESFATMNWLVVSGFILWLIICVFTLAESYVAKPPHKLEEMQTLEGRMIKIIHGSRHTRGKHIVKFTDFNNTLYTFYIQGSYDKYYLITEARIKIWYPKTRPDENVIKQIEFLNVPKYYLQYDYEQEMDMYRHEISDYHRYIYVDWGIKALVFLILNSFFVKLIKKRRNTILNKNTAR